MKKLALILGIALTATVFTVPAYAMGGGMGGGGMMGNWGSGLMDWFQKGQNRDEYARPNAEERRQMTELDRQHQEDSAYLKYQIQTKEKKLDALLESTDPDMEKVRTLHRDIRDLRVEAAQEQHRYEFEAGRMNDRSGGEDSRGAYGPPRSSGSRGMGYGGHMEGYGPDR